MAQGLFDDQKIDVPCPECGLKTKARIGKLKRSPTLRCRAGHDFDVDAKQLLRDLKEVDKAVADLAKSFKF